MTRPTACFAGTRLEALQAFQRFADVRTIITVPDSYVHQYCQTNNLSVQLASRERRQEAFDFLAGQRVQWVLSAGFPFIIPGAVLNSGATFINSHPALLPAYKGRNAIKEAVANGEEFLGVTTHYMVEEVDAGEFIWQEKVWVKGLALNEIYNLLFAVTEPMCVTRAMERLLRN